MRYHYPMNSKPRLVPESDHHGGDRLGIVVSTICAVHCALLPVLLLLLPPVAELFGHEGVEWSLLGVAAVIAAWSATQALRHHRSRAVLLLMASGVLILLAGRWLESAVDLIAAAAASVLGASLLVLGHLHNLRLCRSHRHGVTEPTA